MADEPDKKIEEIPPEAQRSFWNAWNARYRVGNWKVPETNRRQAEIVIGWLERMGRKDLKILEVGCGSGWMASRMAEFGHVTGIDISDEIVGKNADRTKDVEFIAGDFLVLDVPQGHFDVVVTLEVVAHVTDQEAFIEKIARVLRPGGHYAMASQNRIALSRWTNVQPIAPGQIRKWLTPKELKALLRRHFNLLEFTTIIPVGDKGFLRIVNSYKLNWLVSRVIPQATLDGIKERLELGHTMMSLCRKEESR